LKKVLLKYYRIGNDAMRLAGTSGNPNDVGAIGDGDMAKILRKAADEFDGEQQENYLMSSSPRVTATLRENLRYLKTFDSVLR
jgi:hypothetical protein